MSEKSKQTQTLSPEDQVFQQGLKLTLQQIRALSDVPDLAVLKSFINQLRTSDNDPVHANAKIQALIDILQKNPDLSAGLATFVLRLLSQYRQIPLYTDTGISSDESFFASLNRLMGHKFLPLLPQKDSVVDMAASLFDKRSDEKWLASIQPEKWDSLISAIKTDLHHLDLLATIKNNILNAIVILSYRISGIGLHPELMEFYPELLNYSASFVAQNQEAVLFANEYRQAHQLDSLTDITPETDIDPAPLLVMLEQCQDIVNTIRKRIYKTGISIRLTNMLLRLDQSIRRMEILIELVSNNHNQRDKAIIDLIRTLIFTANYRYRFGHLIDNNTKLLSKKVTENASRVGEHYISTDKQGYIDMFKKASIGGFMIAFMATFKILSYNLILAPIGRAFVNSMIYGLGFVFIQVIHGTVATKQPAMTAAAIASTISGQSGKKSGQLNKLADLIVDILRTQFIAIMGNVLVAMPIALLISILWFRYVGEPMIDVDKALHLLHDLDPLHSLALPHAAIAGVYLFLSGLIAGYYDNLAVYNKIGDRLLNHPFLQKILPKQWLIKFSRFIEDNLGTIMGNFLFGVFLGSTATIGFILGLPLDIRHIAFASANLAHGLFNTPMAYLDIQIIVLSIVGVILIGVVNLMVSFFLALFVALRSKDVQFKEWGKLARLLLHHLSVHPMDFFVPRPAPMKYAHLNRQGEIIFEEFKPYKQENPLSKHHTIRSLSDKKIVVKPTVKDKDKTANSQTLNQEGETQNTANDSANLQNANIPLPKPEKPPKLPD